MIDNYLENYLKKLIVLKNMDHPNYDQLLSGVYIYYYAKPEHLLSIKTLGLTVEKPRKFLLIDLPENLFDQVKDSRKRLKISLNRLKSTGNDYKYVVHMNNKALKASIEDVMKLASNKFTIQNAGQNYFDHPYITICGSTNITPMCIKGLE